MQSASYELDSFIDEDTFDAGRLEIDGDILSGFFELLPEIVLEKGEEYFLELKEEKSEYENCRKFFSWLYEYSQTLNNAFQKIARIRELNMDEFEQLFDFCLEKLILHNIGIEAAVNKEQEQELYSKDNLKLMVGLLNTYFMHIFNGSSQYAIAGAMRRSLGLSEEKCEFLWKKYIQNEEALWRKYSMKLQIEINDKLDLFIETFSEREEES